MTGIEIAMAAMMAVGTVISVSGAISQGKFAAAAAERDRVQADENSRLAKLQAAQEEVIRLEEHRRLKASQVAQAAALGFDPTQSRSFMAIQVDTERITDRDIDNIRLKGLLGERRFQLASSSAALEERGATVGSRLSAFGAFASGSGRLMKHGVDTNFFKSTPKK